MADRYTIERELGAGGMATVYLAEDVKHDRYVAMAPVSWGSRPILIGMLSLALMACSESEVPLAVPKGARAGELGIVPCMYEARDVEYGADCGTLVVPENRSDSGSRLIALPVVRLHATGATATEPIFWLAGGPGASNMQFNRLRGLIQSHGIVMVGYRGSARRGRGSRPRTSRHEAVTIRSLERHALSWRVYLYSRRCPPEPPSGGVLWCGCWDDFCDNFA